MKRKLTLEDNIYALERELCCPICLELLNEPTQLSACKHVFCKLCLERALHEAQRNECPVCANQMARRRSTSADPLAAQIVAAAARDGEILRGGKSLILKRVAPVGALDLATHLSSGHKAALSSYTVDGENGGDLEEVISLHDRMRQMASQIERANAVLLGSRAE